jgi:hypothetical protein
MHVTLQAVATQADPCPSIQQVDREDQAANEDQAAVSTSTSNSAHPHACHVPHVVSVAMCVCMQPAFPDLPPWVDNPAAQAAIPLPTMCTRRLHMSAFPASIARDRLTGTK